MEDVLIPMVVRHGREQRRLLKTIARTPTGRHRSLCTWLTIAAPAISNEKSFAAAGLQRDDDLDHGVDSLVDRHRRTFAGGHFNASGGKTPQIRVCPPARSGFMAGL
jgi:hypothetical protein